MGLQPSASHVRKYVLDMKTEWQLNVSTYTYISNYMVLYSRRKRSEVYMISDTQIPLLKNIFLDVQRHDSAIRDSWIYCSHMLLRSTTKSHFDEQLRILRLFTHIDTFRLQSLTWLVFFILSAINMLRDWQCVMFYHVHSIRLRQITNSFKRRTFTCNCFYSKNLLLWRNGQLGS